MLFGFLLFWRLIGWGLFDGSIYPKEAAIYGVIWVALVAGFVFLPVFMIGWIIGIVLLTIVLVLKQFGQGNVSKGRC